MTELADILKENHEDLALIVGNGINLFSNNAGKATWKEILEQIASDFKFLERRQKLPETCSLVEIGDLLQLHNGPTASVQREFCEKIENWKFKKHHIAITKWAKKYSVPILTTNYDTTLSDACGAELVHTKKGEGLPFNRFYPWSSRFEVSDKPIEKPRNSFAIWHVNGISKYADSIRLSLSHYMGSVQQARAWMHRGDNWLFANEEAIN